MRRALKKGDGCDPVQPGETSDLQGGWTLLSRHPEETPRILTAEEGQL